MVSRSDRARRSEYSASYTDREVLSQAHGTVSFLCKRRKGKKELVSAGIRIVDDCQSACLRQLGVAKQMAEDVCGKKSTFWVIAAQEFVWQAI